MNDMSLTAEQRLDAVYQVRELLRTSKVEKVTRDQDETGSTPLEPTERLLVDAYIKYAGREGLADSVAASLFLVAGRIFYRHDDRATAIPMFARVVEEIPDAEGAEYATNMLLDSLIVERRYDEMIWWVGRLRNEPKFATLRKKVDRLDILQQQIDRKAAEKRRP